MSTAQQTEAVDHLFVEVGQGDLSFIVLQPARKTIMVDCNDSEVALRYIEEYQLQVETIVCTHSDQDHIRGVEEVILNLQSSPLTVYVPVDRNQGQTPRHLELFYQFLVEQAQQGRITLLSTQTNRHTLHSDPQASIVMALDLFTRTLQLHAQGQRLHPNALCAIVTSRFRDQLVCIGADAEAQAWRDLFQRVGQAHTMRAPHHGASRNLDLPALYAHLAPRYTVISVGSNNSHEHPSQAHIDEANAVGSCVFCTQRTPRCGTPQAAELHTPSPFPRFRNRSPEESCAGTVWVSLRGEYLEIAPRVHDHQCFVETLSSPMCVPSADEEE